MERKVNILVKIILKGDSKIKEFLSVAENKVIFFASRRIKPEIKKYQITDRQAREKLE